jgi:hypothetical protein
MRAGDIAFEVNALPVRTQPDPINSEHVFYLDVINHYIQDHKDRLGLNDPAPLIKATHQQYPEMLAIVHEYAHENPEQMSLFKKNYIKREAINDFMVYFLLCYDWNKLVNTTKPCPKAPKKKQSPKIKHKKKLRALRGKDIRLSESLLHRNIPQLKHLTRRERQEYAEIQDDVHDQIYGDQLRLYAHSLWTHDYITKNKVKYARFFRELNLQVQGILDARHKHDAVRHFRTIVAVL